MRQVNDEEACGLNLYAKKLTAAGVDRYIEAKLAEDYMPASVNRQTGLLAQALRLAHRRGTLASVLAVRRLPERNARQGFLERVDLDQVVAALPEYLQDLVRFAYLTAWRRGELVSLRWSDVDRDGGVIRLRPEHSKNGRGRTVAIEGDLCAIVERRWQARQVKNGDGSVRIRRDRVPPRRAPDRRLPQGVGPGLHRGRPVSRGRHQRGRHRAEVPHPAVPRSPPRRRAQHGARRRTRAGCDGDLWPSHARDLRSLQHRERGGSQDGDAADERLRECSARRSCCNSATSGGFSRSNPASRGCFAGERWRVVSRKLAEGEGFEPPRASRPGGCQVRTASPFTMS